MDFAVPGDHRVKLKESEKRDKYLDLAKELKILWSMKVTVIPIVIGVLGTITKVLKQGLIDLEIREQVKAIQTTAWLRSARILRRVWEAWGDLLFLRLQWKFSKEKNNNRKSTSVQVQVSYALSLERPIAKTFTYFNAPRFIG